MSDLGPRERLIALLVVYDATSLDKVDLLLHEFEGREKALFEVFARRFGLTLAQAWDTVTLYEAGSLASPPSAPAPLTKFGPPPKYKRVEGEGSTHTSKGEGSTHTSKGEERKRPPLPPPALPVKPSVHSVKPSALSTVTVDASTSPLSEEEREFMRKFKSKFAGGKGNGSRRRSANDVKAMVVKHPILMNSPMMTSTASSPGVTISPIPTIPSPSSLPSSSPSSSFPSSASLSLFSPLTQAAGDSPISPPAPPARMPPISEDKSPVNGIEPVTVGDVGSMSREELASLVKRLVRERDVLQVTLSKVSKFVKRPSRLSSATGSRSPLTSLSEPAGEEEVSSTPSPKQYEDLLALVSTLQQQLVDVERAKGVLERNVRDLLQSSVVGIQAYSAPPTPTTSFRPDQPLPSFHSRVDTSGLTPTRVARSVSMPL